MIEKIKNICIKYNFLDSKTGFPIIDSKDDKDKLSRLNFIYGKNGSGKTTLSNTIQAYKDNLDKNNCEISFLDENDNDIKIESENIYVFNENFIDKNIRVKETGINSIVLIGKQVELQKDIDENKYNLSEVKEKIDSNNTFKLSCENDIKGLNKSIKKILDEKWKIEEKEITGSSKISNNSFQLDKMDQINIDDINKEDIEKEYTELKNKFKSACEINNKFDKIGVIELKESDELDIQNLLKKEVKKPILSDRENEIYNIIKEFSFNGTTNTDYFSNKDNKLCPYCYQGITDKYREELLKSLSNIYNKDSEKHKSELKNINLDLLDDNMLNINLLDLNKELYGKIKDKIKIYNGIIGEYNKKIHVKINNLHSPITDCDFKLYETIEELNKLINEFNDKIETNNKILEDLEYTKNKLQDLNFKITAIEIKDFYKKLKNKEKEKKVHETNIEKLNENAKQLNSKIKDLNNEISNIKIAKDNINTMLRYIFYNEDYLVLDTDDKNQYVLKLKGKDVKPSDISTGERNILALCYFFTLITEKTEEDQLYSKEILVVIDDPISSFDLNNKIGIITFLVRQINEIINGNKNSKILLFSHELYTIISLSNKDNYNIEFNSYIISDFKLEKKDISRYNTYKELFNQVYDYASDINDIDEMYIGNTMRKVLEAFSTFIFNTGINSVMKNEKLLNDKLNSKLEYFHFSMHRLVLNNESHTENAIKHIDNSFYQNSEEEKKKVAKDIICFMYLVSNVHVISMLNDEQKIKNIEKWINAIKQN